MRFPQRNLAGNTYGNAILGAICQVDVTHAVHCHAGQTAEPGLASIAIRIAVLPRTAAYGSHDADCCYFANI